MKRKRSQTNPDGGPGPSQRMPSSLVDGVPGFRTYEARLSGGIRAGDAKTSEYAFFKKIKEDHAGQGFHSYPPCNEEARSEKSKSRNCMKETTRMLKQRSTSPRTSSTPICVYSFPSLSQSSSLTDQTEKSGKQCHKEDIFSLKRRKLCQWVKDTTVPEIDELSSKGYDVVSLLLSRLFPDGNGNSFNEGSKLRQARTDTKSQLFLPESVFHFQEPHFTPMKSLVGSDSMQSLDDGSLTPLRKELRKRVPSKCDFVGFGSPTFTHSKKSNCQYRGEESDYTLDGGRIALLSTENDSSLDFPAKTHGSCQCRYVENDCDLGSGRIEKLCYESYSAFDSPARIYRSLGSSHLKDLNEIHPINEYLSGRKPDTTVLGSDFDNMKDEENWSLDSVKKELSMYPASSDSWGEDHLMNQKNKCGANWMKSSWRCTALGSIRLKYLNQNNSTDESFGKESNPLLGLDFDNTIDENWSLNSLNRELSMQPTSHSSCGDNHQKNQQNRGGASWMSVSNLLRKYSSPHSSSYTHGDIRGCVDDYKYLWSSLLMDLNQNQDINRSSFGKESSSLKGLDFDNMKNEKSWSPICLNRELSTYPASPISWGNVHEKNQQNRCPASWIPVSNLPPNYSSPHICSSSYSTRVHDGSKYLPIEWNKFPLARSSNPHHFILANDFRTGDTSKSEKHHLLSAQTDLDSGWEPYQETVLSQEHCLSSYLALHFNKKSMCLDLTEDKYNGRSSSPGLRTAIDCFVNDIRDCSLFSLQLAWSGEATHPRMFGGSDQFHDGEIQDDDSGGGHT